MTPFLLLTHVLLGCNEYVVTEQPDPPVAEPPGSSDPGDAGDAPDWTQCQEGYLGHYYNLTVDHPDVEPEGEILPVEDPDVFDWWDENRLVFERYDASLDQGASWWPVDDGLAEDPAYYAARWTAWVRVGATGEKLLVLARPATPSSWSMANSSPASRQANIRPRGSPRSVDGRAVSRGPFRASDGKCGHAGSVRV